MNIQKQNKILKAIAWILGILLLLMILLLIAVQFHIFPFNNSTDHTYKSLQSINSNKKYDVSKNLTSKEQIELEKIYSEAKRFINKIELNASIPGDPVSYDTAYTLTENYLNFRNSDITKHDQIEKSVYFYKEDFNRLFRILDSLQCDSNEQAIRAYFGKYSKDHVNSNNNQHPFADRMTIILRAVCGVDDVKYRDIPRRIPSTDYGEICPPNCEPEKYDARPPIQERKDGENGTSSGKGYFLKK